MAANLLDETPVPLAAAARAIPGSRGATTANPATIWRWCRKGTKRRDGVLVRLEFYRLGARLFTTREALARYSARLSDDTSTDNPPTRTPSERMRASERAAAELQRMGA